MNFFFQKLKYFLEHQYRLRFNNEYKVRHSQKLELDKIKTIPRYRVGVTNILGKPFAFVDSASFCFIYNEIFNTEIYKFNCQCHNPYIIDAGANIGLSVVYFKKLFPESEIVAFEPDPAVFDVLASNIRSFGFKDVTIIRKALWKTESEIDFYSEGADAGRLIEFSDFVQKTPVKTEQLRTYLSKKVDFLKIDIEGAETVVLNNCADLLHHVERIFVEYHSFVGRDQDLHELLLILSKAGFRYIIQHIGVYSRNPFAQLNKDMGMDNQLNIFAYRKII
jgi:FkbM family methyltransferase